ncbi:MAG: hypothetical protein AB1762_15950 [Gemmatimonadota bacterium]
MHYAPPGYVCTSCGHQTVRVDRVKPGSGWLTATLLCLFVVPGVVYWVWRHTSKQDRCPLCGRASTIPAESPIGRSLIQNQGAGVGGTPPDLRFDRIEQAIDAIAIEVERVAESQRYAARLINDRSASAEPPHGERK